MIILWFFVNYFLFCFLKKHDKMKIMKKENIVLALLAGEGVAGLIFGFIKNSQVETIFGLKSSLIGWILIFILPLISLLGLYVCYLIGKKILFIFQIAKFFLIGVLTTLFDLGIMNILIWIFGIFTGWSYNLFKAISFLCATIAKYWANKFLAFENKDGENMKKEFTKFLSITVVSFFINIGVASFIVNTIKPQFGLNEIIWANVGAIIASIIGSLWNFIGYKFIVFKK